MVDTKRPIAAVVVLFNIAAAVIFSGHLALADQTEQPVLAAELLIVRDDIRRLETGDALPPAHRRGLKDRISGALGLLPWLLRQSGDNAGADALRGLDSTSAISQQLDRLIARHRLDLSPYSADKVTAAQRREARAIHDAYCAGCHDDAGQGDEDASLPARDLYLMATESTPETFLARLINGVKGDATLLFTNPLTTDQLRALWSLYRQGR